MPGTLDLGTLSVKIKGDRTDLKREINATKSDLVAFNKYADKQGTVKISADKSQLDKGLAKSKSDIRELTSKHPVITPEIDGSRLRSGLSSAESLLGNSFGKFKSMAVAAGSAIVAGLSIESAINQVRSAIDAASNLQQSMGGVDAVFKNNAGEIHAWARAAASNLGLSENAANQFAAVLGAQLKNAGTPLDQVAKKTKTLVQLGADLSATYGGTVADAVDSISAALKGEMDPIEKYGISLNQAILEQVALTQGIKGSSSTWTVAQKQQVIMAALYKQSTDAAGQFSAQTDTLGEQQQIATAKWENAKAKLATGLLPVLTTATSAFGDLAGKVVDATGKADELSDGALGRLKTAGSDLAGKIRDELNVELAAAKHWFEENKDTISLLIDKTSDFIKNYGPLLVDMLKLTATSAMETATAVAYIVEQLDKLSNWWDRNSGILTALSGGLGGGVLTAAGGGKGISASAIMMPGLTALKGLLHFADGGIVPATPGGRVVHVAEGGSAEAIAPLDKLYGMIVAAVREVGDSGRKTTNNITVNNPVPERASTSIGSAMSRLAYLGPQG